jgi:hypothetical protein
MFLGLKSPFDKSLLGSDLVQGHKLAARTAIWARSSGAKRLLRYSVAIYKALSLFAPSTGFRELPI